MGSEMIQVDSELPESREKRLAIGLDLAWAIVKAQFRGRRIDPKKEAPFQHYYARVLSGLGELFAVGRHEHWIVDLETRETGLVRPNHTESIDVVCEVHDESGDPVKAAVELKFKDTDKGAPGTSVQSLVDIYRLERCVDASYALGRFLIATNNKYCWMEPDSSEIRQTFGIYEGRVIEPGEELEAKNQTSRSTLNSRLGRDSLRFKNRYEFSWDPVVEYRFLGVPVE